MKITDQTLTDWLGNTCRAELHTYGTALFDLYLTHFNGSVPVRYVGALAQLTAQAELFLDSKKLQGFTERPKMKFFCIVDPNVGRLPLTLDSYTPIQAATPREACLAFARTLAVRGKATLSILPPIVEWEGIGNCIVFTYDVIIQPLTKPQPKHSKL